MALTFYSATEIRQRYAKGGEKITDLCRRYQVSETTVRRIVANLIWFDPFYREPEAREFDIELAEEMRAEGETLQTIARKCSTGKEYAPSYIARLLNEHDAETKARAAKKKRHLKKKKDK